jgi:DNA-binding GntR family transcriptional regulator
MGVQDQVARVARRREREAPPLVTRGAAASADMAEDARRRLEEMIVTLELGPGTVWSENELSAMLQIGRTPVREALKRLEIEHLVEIVPRSGARITDVDVMQQLLMLEMRRELEHLIVTSAARRSTEAERAKCVDIARHFEEIQDLDIIYYLRYHYSAQRFLAECARNPFVASAILPCYAMSRRFFYLHQRVMHDVTVAAAFHASVFDAVASGDEKRAARASRKLMDYTEEMTRRTVLDRA